jgi:hypothetical protein
MQPDDPGATRLIGILASIGVRCSQLDFHAALGTGGVYVGRSATGRDIEIPVGWLELGSEDIRQKLRCDQCGRRILCRAERFSYETIPRIRRFSFGVVCKSCAEEIDGIKRT